MASKRKLNQTSNYEEKSSSLSLSSSNKRNKKTEDVLASIITVLTDIINFILICNLKWVQISFYNRVSFMKYGWIVLLKDKTTKICQVHSKCIITMQTDNATEFENNIMNQFGLR